MAYDDIVSGVEQKDGSVYIIMKSGKRILYDDKMRKSPDGKMANPDIQDMMEQAYPLETTRDLMDTDFDPGRFRVYALLKEAYGSSCNQVQSNLVNVRTSYGMLQFNKNNNAAAALKEVLRELAPLSRNRQDIQRAIFPSSGTFNYRYIAGTNLLSPHSFGIAIDLARDSRDYWKWASRKEGQKRLASYPEEVVTIFEKHNFIWGGKWGHFDILHFEYRPEIIYKAKYFNTAPAPNEIWYKGVPEDDLTIKKYIELIENAI